ncbi:MAG: hypothetical protein STSR0008_12530 [Ignavibacterium sp.]
MAINLTAQEKDDTNRLINTGKNIYEAVSSSINWYDLPILGLYINRKNTLFNDKIDFNNFYFDHEIQEAIDAKNKKSFGSMDEDLIPYNILYGRIIINLSESLLFPNESTPSDFKHTFVFYKTLIYTKTITEFSKNLFDRKRPDGSDDRSFYSGHSATTFAFTTFLYREINDYANSDNVNENLKLPIKILGFTTCFGWGSYVAYSRMKDNKHYFSDVLVGSLSGILISNFIYNHQFNKDTHKSLINNFNLGIIKDNPTVSFTLNF